MEIFQKKIWAFPTADVQRHLPRAIAWIPRWRDSRRMWQYPQPPSRPCTREVGSGKCMGWLRVPFLGSFPLQISIKFLCSWCFGVCRCFHLPKTSQLLRRIQAHYVKLQLYSHVHSLHFPCKNSKRTSGIVFSPVPAKRHTELIKNNWHIHSIHLLVAPYRGTLRHIATCAMKNEVCCECWVLPHWWYVYLDVRLEVRIKG